MQRRTILKGLPLILATPQAVFGRSVWSSAAALPLKIQEIYPTVHQGRLVVAGGIAARAGVPYFTNRCFSYEPSTDAWSELPTLPEDLHHVALVSTGADLLAIGGFNGGYSHVWRMRDQVYRLVTDTEIPAWVPHSTLPTPQAEGVAAFHAGRVHVITGQQPKGEANGSRSHHTESRLHWVWGGAAWESLAPIPTPRNSATGGWIDGHLIVAGGRTSAGNLATTEIYDAAGDRWHDVAPMPLPQAGTASVAEGGSLYVFGGEIFQPEAAVFANAWRYDFAADVWHALPALPTPRHGLGAGSIDGRIYVIGGATKPSGRGTSDLSEVLSI